MLHQLETNAETLQNFRNFGRKPCPCPFPLISDLHHERLTRFPSRPNDVQHTHIANPSITIFIKMVALHYYSKNSVDLHSLKTASFKVKLTA
jgi:hypothetical protein